MREYVDTDVCSVCLQHFRSQMKVVSHLEEKSRRCRAGIATCFRPLLDDQTNACDAADADKARALVRIGRRRHYSKAPVSRMCGPLTRAAYVAGLSHKSLLRTGFTADDYNGVVDRLVAFQSS